VTNRTCSTPGCTKPLRARGMCVTHYNQQQPDRHRKVEVTCGYCGSTTAKHASSRYTERFCSLICRDLWRIKTGINPEPPRTAPKVVPEKVDRRTPLRRAYDAGDWAGVIAAVKADCDIRPSGCWEWKRKLHASGYAQVAVAGRSFQVHRLTLQAKLGRPLGKQQAHHVCANTFCVNPDHLQPITARENVAEMMARRYMESRIADLEAALHLLDPRHPLLLEVGLQAAS
jgi:hypothetical protein